ncbi:MAG: hypothetical protein M1838_002165 [Thelocarpon superellum]|nr:MAG: hypothetical protein M1838_002165 [Thelocarpon superellum]
MGNLRGAELALLEWINDFPFPLPSKVIATKQLSDGLVLWEMLRSVDPTYFGRRKLPSPEIRDPDYWLPKWQNVKQLTKDVINYLRDECAQTLGVDEAAVPNTKAIAMAKEDFAPEIIKLLKIILMAAVYSPNSNEFLQKMPSLSFDTQATIKNIIEEMSSDSADVSGTASPAGKRAMDPSAKGFVANTGLIVEERLSKVLAENEELVQDRRELQQELAELHSRLVRLQDNNVKQEQEDIIAHDEVKLSELQTERDEQDKTIEDQRTSSSNALKLQDELDEVKIERDGLAKKANALDKYRQKLQATQELEHENRELRTEIEEIRLQSKLADEDRQRAQGLEMTVEQYRQTIERVEQDYSELQTMKRRLELDNAAFAERWETANEQQARDSEMIVELQEKVRELESGAVPGLEENGSLENELNNSVKTKAELRAEISRLKTEMQQIKAGSEREAKNVMLQNLLQDANKKLASLENKYLDTYQAHLVAESQLNSLTRGKAMDGTESFIKLREKHGKAQEALSSLQKRLQELESDGSRLDRELSQAKLDLSMIGKDELEALAKLKEANSGEVIQLRAEKMQVSSRNDELSFNLDQQKSLLDRTLLKLSQQLHETQVSSGDLKSTMDLLNAANKTRDDNGKEELEKRVLEQQQQLNSDRKDMDKRLETIEALRQEALESKEAAAKAEAQLRAAQKNSDTQEVQILRRENALMATAWHDLTNRLQQSNISVQRRDAPGHSFLNRQRFLLKSSSPVS